MVDPAILEDGMTNRTTENIKKPDQTWIIARDEDIDEVGELRTMGAACRPRRGLFGLKSDKV